MLAAGLRGIEEHLELCPPVEKNIYNLSDKEREKHGIDNLPESLGHALSLAANSEFVKETLGTHIFENLLHVKRREWESYRTQVTKWEIDHLLPVM